MIDTPTTAPAGTELTVAQRAAVALGAAEHEQKLRELATQSTEIVAITNPASYQQCHATRMSLKRARIEIEKTGKTARDDAQAFAKAVIAEEKRLIGIIEPEETRLQTIQDAHDAEIERKKAEAARIEAERVDRIQAGIRDIRNSLIDVAGRGSVAIDEKIRELVSHEISAATCQEFAESAEAARTETLAKLREMHATAVRQEAEAARLKAEREELALRQAEQDERERLERERVAAENRRRDEEEAVRRREAEAQQAAMSEINGIGQQVIIAQIGRLGVRVGGTIACIEETLAETEAWPIDLDRFGTLTATAQQAKETAVASIRALLTAAREREAEAKQVREAQEKVDSDRRELEEKQREERLAQEERERADRAAAEAREREERLAREQQEREDRERAEAEQRQREQQEREAREAEEVRRREEQRKADELLDGREMLATFKGRFGHRAEFSAVVKAIDSYLGAKAKAPARANTSA